MDSQFTFPSLSNNNSTSQFNAEDNIKSVNTQININDDVHNEESDLEFFVKDESLLFNYNNENEIQESSDLSKQKNTFIDFKMNDLDKNNNFKYLNDDYIVNPVTAPSTTQHSSQDINKLLRNSFKRNNNDNSNLNLFNLDTTSSTPKKKNLTTTATNTTIEDKEDLEINPDNIIKSSISSLDHQTYMHENLSQLRENTPGVAINYTTSQDVLFNDLDKRQSSIQESFKIGDDAHGEEHIIKSDSHQLFDISKETNIKQFFGSENKEDHEITENITSFFPEQITTENKDLLMPIAMDKFENEWKSPSEYALHILFTKFVRYSEGMLTSCLQYPSNDGQQEPPIIDIMGPDRNKEFDNVIHSLGYIAKGNLKPVVDAMMFWRKSKSQLAADANLQLEKLLKQYDSINQDLSDLHSGNTSFSETNIFNRKKSCAESANQSMSSLDLTNKNKKSQSLTRKLTHKALGIRSFSITSRNSKSKKNKKDSIDNESLKNLKPSQSSQINHNISSNSSFINESLANSKGDISTLNNKIEQQREECFILERKSLISIYILSRVLIEIVKQCEMTATNVEYLLKLEEIVFIQLKNTDPQFISHSSIRTTNWDSFAELLGWISDKSFISVSDKFVSALEKLTTKLTPEEESKAQLLILDMRYLKLKNYPLENFEECADFVQSIAKFFSKTKNEYVRLAYGEVLTQILLPLSGLVSAEVNHPVWVDTVKIILETCDKLIREPKWWSNIFKLIVATLSVAPAEVFTSKWFVLIEKHSQNLKHKTIEEKTTFALGLSRLVWVYLFRCPESLNNTEKKLLKLFSLFVSPNHKDSWLVVEPVLLNALVDTITAIGYHHKNFVIENVLVPIMTQQDSDGNNLEKLEFDQLFILINALRGLILTSKDIPSFPIKENREYEFKLDDIAVPTNIGILEEYEDISHYLFKLFLILDSSCGSGFVNNDTESLKTPLTPFHNISEIFTNALNNNNTNNNSNGHNNNLSDNNNNNNQGYTDSSTQQIRYLLFSYLIKTITCCCSINSKIPLKTVIEILSRNAIHPEMIISEAADIALKSLASKKNPYTLITWFSKYSFDFDEVTTSKTHDLSYLNSSEYKRLLYVYVKLLNCWLASFKESIDELSKKVAHTTDIMNFHLRDPDYETLSEEEIKEGIQQLKNTCAVIDEVEGNGLFFLCSHSSVIRQLGVHVLKIVVQFDELLQEKSNYLALQRDQQKDINSHSRTFSAYNFFAEKGTRVIDLLENCNYYSLIPANILSKFSAAEKQRIAELTTKQNNNILLKIVISDYGVDAALWIRCFPKLLDVVFKACPMAMALCRSIVCIRLVQLRDVVCDIASGKTLRNNIVPENVVSQWKVYIIVACSLLTSTDDISKNSSEQDMQNHKRKKSQQVYTIQHKKIKSATSIFKMVLPLLNTKNTVVKNAIISGLSSININIYGAFLVSVEKILNSWKYESSSNIVRIEIFHILTTASSFFEDPIIFNDREILAIISKFLKSTKLFLNDTRVQNSLTFQPLRLYFSEMLGKFYQALMNNPDNIEEFLPFEGKISCFNYLMEWCNYGEYQRLCQQRYDNIIKNYSGTRDFTSIVSSIEFYKTKLEKSTLETMVQLLNGSVSHKYEITTENGVKVDAYTSFNIDDLMKWIKILFSDKEKKIREVGCQALTNLLNSNKSNRELYDLVLKECFYNCIELDITELYYTTIIKCLLKDEDDSLLVVSEEDAVTLGLFGIVNKRREVRSYGIDLLSKVEKENHDSSFVKVFKERLSNDSRFMFKNTSVSISNVFAELPSNEKRLTLFSKICFVVELLNIELKGDLVALLIPWVTKIELKHCEDIDTFMTLNNMMAITAMCNDYSPTEVEQLWIALAKGNSFQNFNVIIDYILQSCLSSRNPKYVEMCRDVMMYLSTVPGGSAISERLINEVDTKNTIPNNQVLFKEPFGLREKYDDILDVKKFIPYKGKDVYFSKCHLSIIFLVNLLEFNSTSLEPNIPLLLHVCLILLDHYIPLIQESAGKILCNLIYILNPSHEETEITVSLIKDKSHLWAYNQLVKDNKGSRSPKTMDIIIKNILTIIGGNTHIQEVWQRVACKWATLCAVRHIACRSFQVFRCLIIVLDLKMLKEMLHRLANTICDENADVQGFSMQILMSFNAMTAELSPEKLIEFPQLFWALVACLNTVHEQEFIEVLSSLNKFISKIDLDSPDTIQCLGATFPVNWEGKFDGLQNIIMIGLRSSNSYELCLELLNKLNLLNDSKIIANSENRVLYALLSNLANFLKALDDELFLNEIIKDCDGFIGLCDRYNEPSLSRLITSLKLQKFRSRKDFISQITSFISRNYMENYAGPIVIFLIGLLLNKSKDIRKNILEFLKHFFISVDLNRPEFIGVGADLILPLLSLLLTEFESDALEVISCIPEINGNKIDKDILRISLGDRALKNNYNSTPTLYGVPDEDSGWCIPMPAITSADTRNNVQAVYSTCHIKVNVSRVNVKNPNYEDPNETAQVEPSHIDLITNEPGMTTNEDISISDEIQNSGISISGVGSKIANASTDSTIDIVPENNENSNNNIYTNITTIEEEEEEEQIQQMQAINDTSSQNSVIKTDMDTSKQSLDFLNDSYSALEEVEDDGDDEDILAFMPLLKHIIREDEEEEEDDSNAAYLDSDVYGNSEDFEEEGRRMMLLYEHYSSDTGKLEEDDDDGRNASESYTDLYGGGSLEPRRSTSVNKHLQRSVSSVSGRTSMENPKYGGVSYSSNSSKTNFLFSYYSNSDQKNVSNNENNNNNSKLTDNINNNNNSNGKKTVAGVGEETKTVAKKRTKMAEKLKRKPYRLNTRVISPTTAPPDQNKLFPVSKDKENNDYHFSSSISPEKSSSFNFIGTSTTPTEESSSKYSNSVRTPRNVSGAKEDSRGNEKMMNYSPMIETYKRQSMFVGSNEQLSAAAMVKNNSNGSIEHSSFKGLESAAKILHRKGSNNDFATSEYISKTDTIINNNNNTTPTTSTSTSSLNMMFNSSHSVAHKLSSSRLNIFTTPKLTSSSSSNVQSPNKQPSVSNRFSSISNNTITKSGNGNSEYTTPSMAFWKSPKPVSTSSSNITTTNNSNHYNVQKLYNSVSNDQEIKKNNNNNTTTIVNNGNNNVNVGNSTGSVGDISGINTTLNSPTSLSHMWTELDNLDTFFTQTQQDNSSTSFWDQND
ncbi:hypothetical protein ACO0SA_001579 [Hanseniaspora valbyensis]